MIIEVKGAAHTGKTNRLVELSKRYKNPIFISTEETSQSIIEKGFKGVVKEVNNKYSIEKICLFIIGNDYDAIIFDNPSIITSNVDRKMAAIHEFAEIDVIYSAQLLRGGVNI